MIESTKGWLISLIIVIGVLTLMSYLDDSYEAQRLADEEVAEAIEAAKLERDQVEAETARLRAQAEYMTGVK